MDEQRSKIPVATLADPEQDRPISRRVLARHQPDIGGKLPTVSELLAITVGGDHRRGDLRTNAVDGAQSSVVPPRKSLSRAPVLLCVKRIQPKFNRDDPPPPGVLGRVARGALALTVLDLAWRLVSRSDSIPIDHPLSWIYTAIAFLLLPYVVCFGFGVNRGREVQGVVLAAGLCVALWSWIATGTHLGTLTWWWMYGLKLYVFAHLGLSLALAAIFGTRGNEMRAIPQLIGTRGWSGEHDCAGILCAIDRWEVKQSRR